MRPKTFDQLLYIADTRALGEAVACLRAETGTPVITKEVAQFIDDPTRPR